MCERCEELEKRVRELEVFRLEALEMFHFIGRVFSVDLELAKRDRAAQQSLKK